MSAVSTSASALRPPSALVPALLTGPAAAPYSPIWGSEIRVSAGGAPGHFRATAGRPSTATRTADVGRS